MGCRRALLVGVAEPYASSITRLARRYALDVVSIEDPPQALVSGRHFCLCVMGACGGKNDTRERVRSLRKALAGAPLIVLADDLSTDTVVALMRLRVADVVGTPAPAGEVAARVLQFLSSDGGGDGADGLVGRTPVLDQLRRDIETISATHSTVLVTGETGTGKGLVARLIHEKSERADLPYIHVDCAALSPTLIESELFGHERGAFTGADQRRPGRFELAGEGTIFLDEIGDLALPLQSKLLRVLQDREFERLGGGRTQTMKARVIAATSRDLRQAIEERAFRTDLYFRLNVFRIHMPPLRERTDDIPLLVRHTLEHLETRLGIAMPHVSDGFIDRAMAHDWPGNVRELQNVLERILVRGHGATLEPEQLQDALETRPPTHRGPAAPPRSDAPSVVDESDDRDRVATALRATGGNVARSARRLGIPRSTLRHRIKRYRLQHLIPDD